MELKDAGTSAILLSKGYKEIYREIRGAVDLCHRDGSLKKAVAANPDKYIHQVCMSCCAVSSAKLGIVSLSPAQF